MYKIKPYYEYIQTELINYIKSSPDQWQAKVLALLGFNIIYSFDEIIAKTDLSSIYVLKALIVSEKYDITLYSNDGWVLNKKLDIDDLNDYLGLDITDFNVGNDRRMKRLIDGLQVDEMQIKTKEPVLTEEEKCLAIDATTHRKSREWNEDNEPPIMRDHTVSGDDRKKSKEWNEKEAIGLGHEIQDRIRRINEEKKKEKCNQASTEKRRSFATQDAVKSERLFIKLCMNYPEYEHYITRHHKKDPSYRMMLKIAKKIDEDFWEELKSISE